MGFPIKITDGLVVDYRAREWCRLPYLGHPHGCPNYKHKQTCPPQICLIEDFVDLDAPLWLVVEPFDLATHVDAMLAKHPDWSERQARCVLYWQGGVNKRLTAACVELAQQVRGIYTTCPEAMGVQVIKTAKKAGLPIQARPTDWVFKIGLVGKGRAGKVRLED